MEEMVLLYNLEDSDHGKAICAIFMQLGVHVKHLEEEDFKKQIGYLVNEDGYLNQEVEADIVIPTEELLIMHGFHEEQTELVLSVFKNANIPFIPLKAITTPNNIEWSVYKLYTEIKKEYEDIVRKRS